MLLFFFNLIVFLLEFNRLCLQIVGVLFDICLSFVWKKPKKSVEGEVVLITGAANGLGRHLALKFAKLGAILVLWDKDREKCDKVVNDVKNIGGIAYGFQVDVSDYEQVEQTSLRVRQSIGDVFMLVNNAAILNCYSLFDLNPRQIEQTIKTNLMSHFWTTKCFVPRMCHKGKGHIVAISSNMGLYGRSYFTDYSASKFGINGFMQALDDELRSTINSDVHLTTVCPSAIDTGLSKPRETRFPRLLPLMSVDYAAVTIVDAVLKNEHLVIIPTGYKVLYYILSNVPRKVEQLILDFIGSTVEPKRC